MNSFKQHAENIFKLLGLIIISSELGIIYFLRNAESTIKGARILQSMPTVLEYLSVAFFIYIAGFILWCVLLRRLEKMD